MKILRWTLSVATASLLTLMPFSGSLAIVPTSATRTLLNAKPSLQGMVKGERLIALYGVPLASDSDPDTTTDQFVDNWLFDPVTGHKDSLGIDNVVLVLKDKINIRNNKFRVYTYTQQIEGLPVHGSIVKIPVLLGATEKIPYVGMRLVPHPQAPLPLDVLSAADAITVVQQSATYGHLTNFTPVAEAEKVIYEASIDALDRMWRFSGWDDDESYLFFVDTNSGEIIGAHNQIFNADVSGTVTGFATPCLPPGDPLCATCSGGDNEGMRCAINEDCPPAGNTCEVTGSGCCPGDNPNNLDSCPQQMGMRGVQVSATQEAQVFEVFADDMGFYNIPGLTANVSATIETKLIGQWVTVKNAGGLNLDPEPLSQPVTPPPEGVTDVDFVFNPNPDDPSCFADWQAAHELDTAQVNAFLAVQKTHDWFIDLQPTFTGIDKNISVTVNVDPCDAQDEVCPPPLPECPPLAVDPGFAQYNSGNESITSVRAFNGCWTNAASPTIISHEYGHFILDQLLNLSGSAFHEGVADTVAALKWDTELMGLGLSDGPLRDPFRNVDSPDVDLGGGQLALTGAFWDLQKNLRCCADNPDGPCTAPFTPCTNDNAGDCADLCIDRPTDELFADFLFITDGALDQSVLVEVLIADDDDGNLTSVPPTPNSNKIMASFVDLHGWPPVEDLLSCGPQAGDVVDVSWEGPDQVGVFPIPGTDYFVDYFLQGSVCLPHVTLKTTEVVIDFPPPTVFEVERWFIGRTVNNGQPGNLGAVYANWDGPAHDIEVEIGRPPAPPCKNLNVVEIPAQRTCVGGPNEGATCTRDTDCSDGSCSATNWSSTVLQLGGTCVDGADNGLSCSPTVPCAPPGVCTTGNLIGRAQCFANSTGDGGRISGLVRGTAERVFAEGIGTGAGGALETGILDVEGEIKEMTLGTIPSGSTLIAAGVGESVEITGEHDGTIRIQGDLTRRIAVSGAGLSDGDILVDGDISLSGRITINGAMSGNITASGALTATAIITVLGEFNGDICASNLSPGEPLPPPHVINEYGTDATVCEEPPFCTDANPPTPELIPNAQGTPVESTKNRFLSFVPGASVSGRKTAIRVTFFDLPPPFDVWNGATLWVDEPKDVSENSGTVDPAGAPGAPTFKAARLQCTGPVYMDWSTQGTVHVFHEGIVPDGIYEIQAVDIACNVSVETNFTDPLELTQAKWGDTVKNCTVTPCLPPEGINTILDVLSLVDKFINAATAITKARAELVNTDADIGGCVNLKVDIIEVLRAVDALLTLPYPFTPSAPNPCDSTCPDPFLPPGPPPPASASFTLVANSELIQPGEGVDVDVFVSSVDPSSPLDMGGYQVALEVTGGTAGTLTLTAVTINETRLDYVFGDEDNVKATDVTGRRMGNGLMSGAGVPVTGPGYLTTFSYVPTDGAEGEFHVAVKGGEESLLADSNLQQIPSETGGCTVIGVGVDCLTDAHCNDNNDCTLDTCVANECTFTNQPAGFACNDGQFCTTGETCDGLGTCTGGGPTCGARQVCCEFTDECAVDVCPMPELE